MAVAVAVAVVGGGGDGGGGGGWWWGFARWRKQKQQQSCVVSKSLENLSYRKRCLFSKRSCRSLKQRQREQRVSLTNFCHSLSSLSVQASKAITALNSFALINWAVGTVASCCALAYLT